VSWPQRAIVPSTLSTVVKRSKSFEAHLDWGKTTQAPARPKRHHREPPSYLVAEGSCDAARRCERVSEVAVRDGRPNRSARVLSRLLGIAFAAGIRPNQAATIEVRGRTTGRTISFPVVVVSYGADRYLVAMLGDRTNWVRNVRADNHVVLLQGKRENVSLMEDFSGSRATILRRLDRSARRT
jgi:F420H(2)-dependent quinone reductase